MFDSLPSNKILEVMMQKLISVILVGIMSLGLIDCVTKESKSDSAKGQPPLIKRSNEVVKTKSEPPMTIPQPVLSPAVGAKLVDPDNFTNFVMQVGRDYCLKMTGDERWGYGPDDPWKREESRRSRFLNLPAKSEFETNAEYEKRVKKWRVEADAAIEAYQRELSTKIYTTYFKVLLGLYDAERGVFTTLDPQFNPARGLIRLQGPGEISVPIEKAKEWRRRDQQLRLRADYHILIYCGPEGRMSLTLQVLSWKLLFADTGEIIWSK